MILPNGLGTPTTCKLSACVARTLADEPNRTRTLIVVCIHPQTFINNHYWAAVFGEPENIVHEDCNLIQSIRVGYADGREADYAQDFRLDSG